MLNSRSLCLRSNSKIEQQLQHKLKYFGWQENIYSIFTCKLLQFTSMWENRFKIDKSFKRQENGELK